MSNALTIRPATRDDSGAIWAILEPIIRAGETYPLPRDMTRKAALAYWLSSLHTTYLAEDQTGALGTYYIRPNNSGGGAHVANCGYMVAADAQGKGIARAMCVHSLGQARSMGFAAMQFNFVVANNARAVALWEGMGFATVGRLPKAFDHPKDGMVDALVMFQTL